MGRNKVLLGLMLATAITPVAAAEPNMAAAAARMQIVGEVHQQINLSAGTSRIITLPKAAADVMVASDSVATVEVRTPRQLVISAVGDGVTSLIATDEVGNQIAAYEIRVTQDLDMLKEALASAVPGARVTVKTLGNGGVLLTGQAASPLEAEQAADIARSFVGTSGRVVNGISVKQGEQVMLKVTVAEVQRSALKKLGISASGTWEIGKTQISGSLSEMRSIAGGGAAGLLGAGGSIDLAALESVGVSRTLAEPTVVAISGETSTMMVGGDVPVPTGVTCTDGGSCQPSIEYRKYGVSLSFTPVVLDAGRISLKVSTEVSDVDPETSTTASAGTGNATFTIPGFKVRRSDSVVELPSGASLVTAGLIQERTRTGLSGVPGAKDVPLLGPLFRSREYQRQETELVISVTPYLAKATSPDRVVNPGKGFVDAVDVRGVFMGEVNRLYGAKARDVSKAAYAAGAGFIVD